MPYEIDPSQFRDTILCQWNKGMTLEEFEASGSEVYNTGALTRWMIEQSTGTIGTTNECTTRDAGKHESGPRQGTWKGYETEEGREQWRLLRDEFKQDPESYRLSDGRILLTNNQNETDAGNTCIDPGTSYGSICGPDFWSPSWEDPEVVSPCYMLPSIRGAYSENFAPSQARIDWCLSNPNVRAIADAANALHASCYTWAEGATIAQSNFIWANVELFRGLDPNHEKVWCISVWHRDNYPTNRRFVIPTEIFWRYTILPCLQGGIDVILPWGVGMHEYFTRTYADGTMVSPSWYNEVMPAEQEKWTQAGFPCPTRDDYVRVGAQVDLWQYQRIADLVQGWKVDNGIAVPSPPIPAPEGCEECELRVLQLERELAETQERLDYVVDASREKVEELDAVILSQSNRLDEIHVISSDDYGQIPPEETEPPDLTEPPEETEPPGLTEPPKPPGTPGTPETPEPTKPPDLAPQITYYAEEPHKDA